MIWRGIDVFKCVETPPDIDIEPNGVEVGIKEIKEIPTDGHAIIEGDLRAINPPKKDVTEEFLKEDVDGKQYYNLKSGLYEVRLANKVKIPQGVVGLVFPRSSLNRFGISMNQTAIWDTGYEGYGTLTVDVKPKMLRIGVDEKWFQFTLMGAEETEEYDGHWQGEE